ncbi:MAG: LD-carboxypeptidase [Phormidesmis sp. CAN_BIN44]|nr:LD-carboxypeptidase [Phormidesmis sp. CAN_BIN44]
MNRCQPPAPLKPGDLLRVISPSGTLREMSAFKLGVDVWRKRGYRVQLTPGFDDRHGYLAGTDPNRRAQLDSALNDPECKGILCARGGYGGARLLEDWAFPLTDPKWLIGFSDITSLLWSFSHQGISGVHAPLLTTIAAEPDWSKERLFDWVEGRPLRSLTGFGWGGGQTTGLLLPANLTVATHILNTPLQPDLSGIILALEDVSEAPYRIDRMLTQWRLSGALQKVCAIALGRFSQCDPPSNIPSFTTREVLHDRLSDLGIPIVSDLPFGHDGENAALPVGVPVLLDGDRGFLSFDPLR